MTTIENREKWLTLVKKVNAKFKSNTTLPILESALVEDGHLMLTDLETTIRMETDLAPGLIMRKFLRDRLIINTPEEDSDNYPRLPNISGVAVIGSIVKADFDKMKTAVKFAGNDDLRPVMSIVYVDDQVVSTDAHKLYYKDMEMRLSMPIKVSKKAIELLSIFNPESIEVSRNDSHIVFKIPGCEVIIREEEGRFPNYKAVIPQDYSKRVTVNRKILLDAIAEVLPFAKKERMGGIAFQKGVLNVDFNLSLYCADADLGIEKGVTVAAEINGEPICIGFNLLFLQLIIKSIAEDTITITMTEPNRAALINDEYLLMPVML